VLGATAACRPRCGANPRGTTFDVADLVEWFGRSPSYTTSSSVPAPGIEDQWEVVAGHRRVEAVRKLGWSHIGATIVMVDGTEDERRGLAEDPLRRGVANDAIAVTRLLALYEAGSHATTGNA